MEKQKRASEVVVIVIAAALYKSVVTETPIWKNLPKAFIHQASDEIAAMIAAAHFTHTCTYGNGWMKEEELKVINNKLFERLAKMVGVYFWQDLVGDPGGFSSPLEKQFLRVVEGNISVEYKEGYRRCIRMGQVCNFPPGEARRQELRTLLNREIPAIKDQGKAEE